MGLQHQETARVETCCELSTLETKTQSASNPDRVSFYENWLECPVTRRFLRKIGQRLVTFHKQGLFDFAVFVDDDAYDNGPRSSTDSTRGSSRRDLKDRSIANEDFASLDRWHG